ncbi:MAG: acetyl-CoA carboxylase biotin carboxyl carrier protein [Candidatus Eisenbacteria bacterium]|nr:acetyl-CoA carboxylase biotin carboxyl carrier protein [Candidatus Eisenbacteria bacterium]
MDRKQLEELIRLVEDSEVTELSIRNLFSSVRIVKGSRTAAPDVPAAVPAAPPVAAPSPAPAPAAAEAEPGEDSDLVPIVSPMVGTFYESSSPESPAYVRQGDRVSKGQVVCIVEAMKLMNEIESEVSGTVARIEVENAQPVEYGQTLFLVQPD